MSFLRSNSPLHHTYFLNGSLLNRIFLVKDLGIYLTPTLYFDHHINTIIGRALKILGFVKRNTANFTSSSCLRILYFSLVRSVLEYRLVIWHPYLARDELRLERVQNGFLSYAAFKFEIKHPIHDYSLIFSNLRIPSFASRRADENSNDKPNP